MPRDNTEIQKRTEVALAAIKAAYGTEGDEFGVTLFVSHHLGEIPNAYWQERFQTEFPEPAQILESLVLLSDFEDDNELDCFDFTLPGDVTNYLICVTFDEKGEIEDISMES